MIGHQPLAAWLCLVDRQRTRPRGEVGIPLPLSADIQQWVSPAPLPRETIRRGGRSGPHLEAADRAWTHAEADLLTAAAKVQCSIGAVVLVDEHVRHAELHVVEGGGILRRSQNSTALERATNPAPGQAVLRLCDTGHASGQECGQAARPFGAFPTVVEHLPARFSSGWREHDWHRSTTRIPPPSALRARCKDAAAQVEGAALQRR